MFSTFNLSRCTHLEQWAADAAVPGEQSGIWCLAQGSQLSRGQFLLEPRFEPTTSGYMSDALSIRPRLPIKSAFACLPCKSTFLAHLQTVSLLSTFTFSHFADAFIQSDLQLGNT